MKLVYAGAIVTSLVVFLGVAMIAPTFTRTISRAEPLKVLLFFSVENDSDEEWAGELSSVLSKEDVKATVFFTGKFAQLHPNSIARFDSNIDIGSQTFNYVNLTSISDYTIKLQEVRDGKTAVDEVGNLDSRLFRAPFESTDEDIYSLLNRSGIIADFSYCDHYNKFYDGQFIRMEIPIYDGSKYSLSYFLSLPRGNRPFIIFFDDDVPIQKVNDLISSLKSTNCWFYNASELAGMALTVREG